MNGPNLADLSTPIHKRRARPIPLIVIAILLNVSFIPLQLILAPLIAPIIGYSWLSALHLGVFAGPIFWMGFRKGETSLWTYLVPSVLNLFCVMLSLGMTLWQLRIFLATQYAGNDFVWNASIGLIWHNIKYFAAAWMISILMQRAFGLAIAPVGMSQVFSSRLNIGFILICTALIAVICAVDGALASSLTQNWWQANISMQMMSFLYPAIDVLGFFALGWLIAKSNPRRWIGWVCLGAWIACDVFAILAYYWITSTPSSNQVIIQPLSWLSLGAQVWLKAMALMAILGTCHICGYRMAITRSVHGIASAQNESELHPMDDIVYL